MTDKEKLTKAIELIRYFANAYDGGMSDDELANRLYDLHNAALRFIYDNNLNNDQ